MKKYTLGVLAAVCVAGLVSSPARADTIFQIEPASINATAGDVGDSFDVVLTNSSNATSSINVAAFAFEVSVSSTDITLTGADFNTGATPYIFAGDSFDQMNGFTLYTSSVPSQTLDASDLTNDNTNITLAAGQSLALGDILFNVAPGTAPGPFTVSFTGGAAQNNLSDAAGDAINVDQMIGGTITVASAVAVPEPVGSGLQEFALGIAALLLFRGRIRRTLKPSLRG